MSATNCTACQKKYGIFKYNRAKCMECGLGYCLQCIRKARGYGLTLYCDICLILNTRPPNRTSIMDVRSKEVKLYLARRKVSTDHCLEKEDLVNRFLWYVDVEPRLAKNGNKKGLNLNGLMSSFTNSMPNLVEPNIRRNHNGPSAQTNSYNRNTNGESSQSVPHSSPVNYPQQQQQQQQQNYPREQNTVPSSSSYPQQQQQNPPREQNTVPSSSSNVNNENSNSNPPVNTNKPTQRKLIRLSDIKNVEEIPNLTVRQLKELLFINRINITGCVEKEELVKKAVDLWVDSRAQDSDNMATEDLCKICMDAPLNSVLLECGHIATCIDCGKQLAECPICRQYIVRVVHTFKA